MGLCIYPVFKPNWSAPTSPGTGEFLAVNFESLDRIARSARLTPLTAFADNRPVPDGFDGDPEELDEVMGEWTEWFDPSEGRDVVQALADHTKSSSRAAKQLDPADAVVFELEELARVLGAAASAGVRFRLEMS